jgi:signal transduction histidine kinase
MVSLRPRRPSAVDVGLAVFFAVVVVVEAYTEPVVRSSAWHAGIAGPAMLAMAWRRVHPLPVAVAVAVAMVLLAASGGGLSVALALLITSFTLGSEAEGRASRLGLVLLLVLTSVGVLVEANEAVAGDIAAVVTLVVVPWLAGRALRRRADHLARALAHAERIELEREREVELAATQERVRLARELHDVVSHSISVIAIQVQAVRRRLRPDQTREIADLNAVETAAREAMAEMRRLFGVLREQGEHASLSPQPGLGELDRLIGQVQSTGMKVDLVTEGPPHELSPGLDLAAYRIVQEALTNAIRHSGGRHVEVRLGYRPGELRVSVEDDGHGVDPGAVNGHAGHGLRGIRERAELYGGTLDVGRGARGGTRVRARLPVGASR